MENIIPYLAGAIVTIVSLYLLNKYASKSLPIVNKGKSVLVMPKYYMYLGYIGTILFVVILVAWLTTDGYDSSMLLYLIAYPFMIGAAVFLIFTYYRHHASFDDNLISSTNIFGKISEVNWNEITKISINRFSGMIILSTKNGKKVKMHPHLKGIKIVLDKVKLMNVETGKLKIPNFN